MEIIQTALTETRLRILLGIITLAGAYATYYLHLNASKLKVQTAQIKDDQSRKLLENALADVTNLATTLVGAMEQTTAKELREAVKAGKASPDELKALSAKIFNEVKSEIAPETQRVIQDNLGSFDTYVDAVIEDAVRKVKQSDPYITLSEPIAVGQLMTEIKEYGGQ